jgi:hypothetical protein
MKKIMLAQRAVIWINWQAKNSARFTIRNV